MRCPMCGGGGYKPPPPDPELEAQKKAQTEQIEAQKEQQQFERSEDKRKRLQDTVTRASGMAGFRSLIAGRRGGGGFGREMMS